MDPLTKRLEAIDRRAFIATLVNAALLLVLLSLAAWAAHK